MPSQPSFCIPGQAGEKFVGHILAQAGLAEARARDFEYFFGPQRFAVSLQTADAKARKRRVVDLAQVVLEALDFQPVGVRRDHAPGGQVVERGAPQHGLLAAGVHRDIAADARGVRRGRIAGPHQFRRVGRFHGAAGDYAGTAAKSRHGMIDAR